MKKLFIPIHIKLIAIISTIVFLSLGLLTWISLDIFSGDIRAMVYTLNQRTSRLLKEKVETEIGNRILLMKLFESFVEEGSNEGIARSLMSREDQQVFSVRIYRSASGDPIGSFTNLTYLKEKEISSKAVEKVFTEKRDYLRRAQKGEMVIANVSPIVSGPAYFIALTTGKDHILAGVFDLATLSMLISENSGKASPGSTPLYNSFITDPSGQILVHADAKQTLEASDFSLHPAVQHMFRQQTANGSSAGYKWKGAREISAFSKLQYGGLGLLSTMDEGRALEGVKIVRERSLLTSLLIIAIATIFVYFFARTISRPVRSLVRAANRIREGDFKQKVSVRTWDEIELLTGSFNDMAKGLEEREELKGAFGKFVNPAIAQQIMSGSLALGGVEKNVTVFFSDIRSFTTISEKMEPVEVVAMLNQYFTLMVNIVHKSGGVVDKFIGDAIMAVWGAPLDTDRDAHESVGAAVEMRYALREFNEKHRGSLPEIRIGCGLNTGPVLSGQIGAEDRLEYTVIGDTVNLASRLEGLNKTFGTDIIVSEATYAEVKDDFVCAPLEKIMIRGKTQPQRVYAVLGKKNDPRTPRSLAELRRELGTVDKSKTKTRKKG